MSKTELCVEIENILNKKISPTYLEVIDESEAHIGHKGSRETGGAHFRIIAKSKDFVGLNRVARHRMIHDALSDLLKSGCIHARVKIRRPLILLTIINICNY